MNVRLARFTRLFVVVALLAVALVGTPPSSALAQPAGDDIEGMTIANGSNSANAARLLDGAEGTTDSRSWQNSGNKWSDDDYPMSAVIDLGGLHRVTGLRYFAGQIGSPDDAQLIIRLSTTGEPGSFVRAAAATEPTYDAWSAPVSLDGVEAAFVQLRFRSVAANFNIAEIAIQGTRVDDPGDPVDPGGPGDDGGPGAIAGLTVRDGNNSLFAERLIDGDVGTSRDDSWWNPAPWRAASYPMTAVIDLGEPYDVDAIHYFVGNLRAGSDKLQIQGSPDATSGYTTLATPTGHTRNRWANVDIDGVTVQRLRLRFTSVDARFNLAEVRVFGSPVDGPGGPDPDPGDMPRSSPPPADIERAYGFDEWPKDHLSIACQELHDSYWVQGQNADPSLDADDPENLAYHTWHPALAYLDDGTPCDFGHEHGTNPLSAGDEAFDLSGGWPAFGYAAAKAAVGRAGMQRHEDHVGHKVTVATFGAAIGNGANRHDTLYDAGFECTWLSKIHQGSHSLDAFSNHLHEYFLTVMCGDGTEFSVKVMYTYGEANRFVEDNCSQDVSWTDRDDTIFNRSVLTGPEGQSVPRAHREDPVGLDKPNNRGFTCASGVEWKDLETEVGWVDIWTELIKIQQPGGSTALTIQPYYIVKNPARIIAPYDGIKESDGPDQEYELPSEVMRTIDVCYSGATRLDRPFCEGAPATRPAWDSTESPFNGALRAVHFKSSDLRNAGGPEAWCTDAFGHAVTDSLPCDEGNIEQRASSYTNHWNDGSFSNGAQSGNIAGAIWSETPHGTRVDAEPRVGGGYFGHVLGFELVIDNRDPDDDFDGVPDGANLRGQN